MIIYRDIVSGDEMFSDIYTIKEVAHGLIEVEGKMISRTEDIDESLIGANASAEEQCEGTETSTQSGVDIILNHKLEETTFKKDSYKAYIKSYMKAIKAKLEETNPDRVEGFMKDAPNALKHIMANFKDYQMFTGETMNVDGAVGLLNFREDGVTPYMTFFKDGLEIEKC